MRRFGLFFSLVALLPLLVAGCDSASPVAPAGTVLTISATPAQISARGTATIRVVARKSNGVPVTPGTLISFSTNLGEIDPSVATDDSGTALAQLRGNGRKGIAMVTASSGTSEGVTIEVTIGFFAAAISLQTTPSTIPESGGELALLAVVRDDQGQPLPDADVNFRAAVGNLESGGSVRLTDARGEVRDRLAVTAADLDAIPGDTFEVSADVGGSGGTLISTNQSIGVLRTPRANFTFTINNLTVIFTDTSTGNPTSWRWLFDDGGTSDEQNPLHPYQEAGTYNVVLTATNSAGSSSFTRAVVIGSGQ